MPNPLSALYSYGDTLKRRLRDFANNPLEALKLGVTRFGEDQQGLLNMQAEAYPMPGQSSVMQNQAAARAGLADAGANMGMGAATVWHGSPHSFNKFDASKIGTGEGAQAYGHGLYLAENQKVAQGYKDQLSPRDIARKTQTQVDDWSAWAAGAADDSNHAMKMIDELISSSKANSQLPVGFQNWDEFGQYVKQETGKRFGGSLYKVDLPDEHIAKMLDWDKPLSQQAPEVRKALDDLKKLNPIGFNKLVESQLGGPLMEQATGRDLYKAVGHDAFSKTSIPGIRYLDSGSRGAGTGTSNYVVFPGNENILKILARNGQNMP